MYFSPYKVKNNTRTMQSTFYGLNKNARIGDGEFADMLNMSGDYAPLLSPRAPRVTAQKAPTKTVEDVIVTEETAADGTVTETETTVTREVELRLNGILGDVGFAAVWGGDFYYMGKKVEGITLIDSEKKMVAMGADIIIYPDTVYYNTQTGEYGQIETGTTGTDSYSANGSDIYTTLIGGGNTVPCKIEYTDSSDVITEWDIRHPTTGWLTAHYIKHGELPTDMIWNTRECCFSLTNGKLYYLYSALVKISNYNDTASNCVWKEMPIEKAGVETTLEELGLANMNLSHLWLGNENSEVSVEGDIVYFSGQSLFGILDNVKRSSGTATQLLVDGYVYGSRIREKKLPALDYICVHGNRLWGCRYGYQSTNGTIVNQVYCSGLGKFKDWTEGTGATNAYSLSVGEYGEWTGCVSVRGHLLFFKENAVFRVTGDKPTNFRIEKISESGLQKGCEKSLEIIDEVLYYKSRNGVFAYDGSIPQKISDALGNFYYTDAVAGKHFSKYYITMVTGGVRKLYVYDTRTGLWHAEDDADIRFFTEYNGALYGAIDNDVVCLSGTPADIFGATEAEGAVKWSIETGDIGLGSPYQKFLRRLLIRMDMDDNAKVLVDLLGDDGEWYAAMKYMSPHKRSFLMPVVTPRVDHARIRISGVGGVKIYSISYETESAGDRYVESWSQQESARERGAYSDEREMTREEFWGDSAKT